MIEFVVSNNNNMQLYVTKYIGDGNGKIWSFC